MFKKETKKVQSLEQVPTLLVNEEKLKDPTDLATAFNNVFITFNEKLNIQHIEKGDAISILTDSLPGIFPSIKVIPITEAEVKNIIHSLKPKKSGYYEITSTILKACATLISYTLSYIYNHTLYTGTFPGRLTNSKVKPLYKK